MTAESPPSDTPESVTMGLWREAMSASLSQLVALSAGVGLVVTLTRYLPPESVGLFFFLYAGIFMFSEVPRGVARAVRKRVSEESGKQSEFLIAVFLFLIVFTVLGGALIAGISAVLPQELRPGLLMDVSGPMIAAVLVAGAARSSATISKKYLEGLGRPGRADWTANTSPDVLTIAFLAIVLHFDLGGITTLVLCYAAAQFLGAALTLSYACPLRPSLPSRQDIRSLLTFARWSVPNSICNDFYHRFDVFALGLFVGATAVSYYDASLRIALLTFAVSTSLGAATSVNVSGRHAQDLPVTPILRDVTEATSALIFPFLVGVVLVGDTLLGTVYGTTYANAYYFLIGLTAQQVFQGYRFTFEGFFEGVDQPARNFRASSLAVLCNILTAVPFILLFGGIGVILSTLISEVVRVLVFEQFVYEATNGILLPRLVIVETVAAAGAFVALYPVVQALPNELWVVFAVFVAVAVVYTALMAAMSTKFRAVLNMAYDAAT